MSNREAPNRHLKGGKKYKEMIASDSKRTDKFANLPFKFRKPPKRTEARREIYCVCPNCGSVKSVNKNTIGMTCLCGLYIRVADSVHFDSEQGLQEYLQELDN